jgi:hypothetical protein
LGAGYRERLPDGCLTCRRLPDGPPGGPGDDGTIAAAKGQTALPFGPKSGIMSKRRHAAETHGSELRLNTGVETTEDQRPSAFFAAPAENTTWRDRSFVSRIRIWNGCVGSVLVAPNSFVRSYRLHNLFRHRPRGRDYHILFVVRRSRLVRAPATVGLSWSRHWFWSVIRGDRFGTRS